MGTPVSGVPPEFRPEADPALLYLEEPEPAKPYRVIIVDEGTKGLLAKSWMWGAKFLQMRGKAETIIGVVSWSCVEAMLSTRRGITSLQVFGHGMPGAPVIAGHPLDSDGLRRFCEIVKPTLAPGAYVWWRSCSVFAGVVGRAFAARCADGLERRVYGHLDEIGPLQGGLRVCLPGAALPDLPAEPRRWWQWPASPWVTCLAAEPT